MSPISYNEQQLTDKEKIDLLKKDTDRMAAVNAKPVKYLNQKGEVIKIKK